MDDTPNHPTHCEQNEVKSNLILSLVDSSGYVVYRIPKPPRQMHDLRDPLKVYLYLLSFVFPSLYRMITLSHHAMSSDTSSSTPGLRSLSPKRLRTERDVTFHVSRDVKCISTLFTDFLALMRDIIHGSDLTTPLPRITSDNNSRTMVRLQLETALFNCLLKCMKRQNIAKSSEGLRGLLSYRKQRSLMQPEVLKSVHHLEPSTQANSEEVNREELPLEALVERYHCYQVMILHQRLLTEPKFLLSYFEWIDTFMDMEVHSNSE